MTNPKSFLQIFERTLFGLRFTVCRPCNSKGEKGWSIALTKPYYWTVGYRKNPAGCWFETAPTGFYRSFADRSGYAPTAERDAKIYRAGEQLNTLFNEENKIRPYLFLDQDGDTCWVVSWKGFQASANSLAEAMQLLGGNIERLTDVKEVVKELKRG